MVSAQTAHFSTVYETLLFVRFLFAGETSIGHEIFGEAGGREKRRNDNPELRRTTLTGAGTRGGASVNNILSWRCRMTFLLNKPFSRLRRGPHAQELQHQEIPVTPQNQGLLFLSYNIYEWI